MNEYENADKKQQDIIDDINDYNKEEIGDVLGNTDSEPEDPKPPQKDVIEVGDIVTAEDISKVEDKNDIYGEIVEGYDCENNKGVRSWKLLYADSENVYLIASNYIDIRYCPNGKNSTPIDGYSNNLYMENVIKDYNGSSDITDERLKKLNEDYFNKYGSENSTYKNMKAVAYMLDTSENVWGKFAGEKAEYAIGGPTIELLFKSYNEKYKTNNKYQAEAKNRNGYLVSADGGKNYTGMMENKEDFFNVSDELYIAGEYYSVYNPFSLWIASPACFDSFLCALLYDGSISSLEYTFYSTGFRPVVCLKSDVQLEKLENGNFLIK